MRHRLSRLLAAATRVFTLLSPPSNWARLCRRVTMAVTAFCTRETSCWLSMFSGCPAAERGEDVSSCVFLCQAMISSRSTVFRMPSTCGKRRKQSVFDQQPRGAASQRHCAWPQKPWGQQAWAPSAGACALCMCWGSRLG